MPKRAKKPPEDRVERMLVEYREKLPVYENFAKACKELIERLLTAKGVRVHSVTCRAKTLDSLKGKLAREEKQCEALDEVADLAGIRIITYFSDDVDSIGRMIEREFTVISDRSTDKREALDPDRFGYLSVHYVCRVPRRRTRLLEYAGYSGYVCEIQVRSILQHAWAEIEHDLGYKAEQAIPRQIRRRFSRLAGLLETGDEQFMVIRDELAAYASEVKRDIAQKPREVLLDKVSLATFIAQDTTVQAVDEQLAQAVEAKLIALPDQLTERYAERLRSVGMHTIEDVRAALVQRDSVIVRQYQRRARGKKRETLSRGMSVFQLWQVLLAEKGDPAQIIAAFEKTGVRFSTDPGEIALEIINAVREASAEEARARRKRSDEA